MDDIRKIIKESLRDDGKVVKVDEVSLTEPSTFVQKYEGGEEKWKKAKEIASKEGKGDNYAYITGIFKKMVGESMYGDDSSNEVGTSTQVSKPSMPEQKPESKPEHETPNDKPPPVAEGAEIDQKEMKKEDKLHNPSHSLWTAPKGFYQRPSNEIARTLLKVSKNQKQAVARLMFYLNRGGKEMAPADMKRLSMAKDLIVGAGKQQKAQKAKEEEQQEE